MRWEGHDPQQWQRIWAAGAVHILASADSTNDVASHLAEQGAPHFTVVLAEEQTRGRGRSGAQWFGRAGASLLFSVLFRTPQRDGVSGAAPIRVGMAVAGAVEGARVKWPNDIVIPGHGKVAGILCEGTFGSHIIAGIGMNVHQQPRDFPPELRGRACSVTGAYGREVDRAQLLTRVLQALRDIADRLVAPLDAAELEQLAGLDVLRGNEIICETASNEKIRGAALGIAEDGALLIQQDGSLRRLYNGTVRLAFEQAYPGTVRSS